jgi:DNA-directed RNA polymerase subunit E'/Rpb7
MMEHKMEETKILRAQVPMKPKDLAQDPKAYIKKALMRIKAQLTTRESGHVIDVVSILHYRNVISRVTEDILWLVIYEALVVNPKVSQDLMVTVNMVLVAGILCSYHGIKIWVPCHLANGYKFISNTFKKGNDVIKVSDTIQVKVSTVRYDQKAFSCIARLT